MAHWKQILRFLRFFSYLLYKSLRGNSQIEQPILNVDPTSKS